MSILCVDNIDVSYGDTRVIDGISIDCASDEILAVLGRNGMGKTTLLKSLAGVLSVDSGVIMFDNTEITTLAAHERAARGVTLIPQGRDIFPDLTVAENLRMGAFAATDRDPLDKNIIYDYFPILQERADQRGGTLSGGQQQMLAIARGLMTNPKLILLDEPSEGIQPSIVDKIGTIITDIHRKEEIPIVLVEQNADLVFSVAHRGYIIENGRVVEERSIDKLQDDDLLKDRIGI